MPSSQRRATLLAAFLLIGGALAGLRPAAAQADPCRGAALRSPASESVISGTVAILGSARIDSFGFYKLEWASESRPGTWSAVSNVISQPLDQGVLDRWNTQALPDGLYRLKLTVVDQVGQEICRQSVVRLQVANAGPVPTATVSPTPTSDPDDTAEEGADEDAAGDGGSAATLAPGAPTPVEREGGTAGEGSSDGAADDASDGAGAAATAAPVDIAPAFEPSGARLPSFGELSFCFGAGFLATAALALWLWRRQGAWTG